MAKSITFSVEFDDSGRATIRLPEGRTQAVDAASLAKLTEALAKQLGTIEERHIGRWDNGVHVHDNGEVHNHH